MTLIKSADTYQQKWVLHSVKTMTPQARHSPALPVALLKSCSPLPKSSTPAWIDREQPMTDLSPDRENKESSISKATSPSALASTFPRSPEVNNQRCKISGSNSYYIWLLNIIVTARSSGILKAKQKLGRTFNSDKLGGIAFTKISKLTMCSA